MPPYYTGLRHTSRGRNFPILTLEVIDNQDLSGRFDSVIGEVINLVETTGAVNLDSKSVEMSKPFWGNGRLHP